MKRRFSALVCVAAVGLAACENLGGFGQVMEQNPEVTGAVAGALVCGALTGDIAPAAVCGALGAGGGYLYRRQSEGRTVVGCAGDDVPVSKREADGRSVTYCVPRREVERHGRLPQR
jgi:hypothetical protein